MHLTQLHVCSRSYLFDLVRIFLLCQSQILRHWIETNLFKILRLEIFLLIFRAKVFFLIFLHKKAFESHGEDNTDKINKKMTYHLGLEPTNMSTRNAIRLCRLHFSTATATIRPPTNNILVSCSKRKNVIDTNWSLQIKHLFCVDIRQLVCITQYMQ